MTIPPVTAMEINSFIFQIPSNLHIQFVKNMDIYNVPSRVIKPRFFKKKSEDQPLNTVFLVPSFGMVVAFPFRNC